MFRVSCDILGINLHANRSTQTMTLPYSKNNAQIYGQIQSKWENITASYLKSRWTSILGIEFSPFPAIMSKHSASRGGSAMELTANDPDRIIVEIVCGWRKAEDDQIINSLSR